MQPWLTRLIGSLLMPAKFALLLGRCCTFVCEFIVRRKGSCTSWRFQVHDSRVWLIITHTAVDGAGATRL